MPDYIYNILARNMKNRNITKLLKQLVVYNDPLF